MAFQALIVMALAASTSAQSYASSYNSIADPLQSYAPSAPLSSHGAPVIPSPLSYGSVPASSPYDHQFLLQQPSYDVTETPQEPENPPTPPPPPSAPLYFRTQTQDPAPFPLLPQNQPQLPPQPQDPAPHPLLSQPDPSLLQSAPSAPSAPTQLTSHSSTSFSSPYASYQH